MGDCNLTTNATYVPVRFGADMDIVCTTNWTLSKIDAGYMMSSLFNISDAPVRPIPRQPGAENIETLNVAVEGQLPAITGLDGALQEIVFFYRIAGSVGHPQKVIHEISRRIRPVLRQYNVSNGWISRSSQVLRTVVRFIEIPNNVNLELVSGVDTDAEAWLPF
jgi:hypothetical protein